jgi:callose synthase
MIEQDLTSWVPVVGLLLAGFLLFWKDVAKRQVTFTNSAIISSIFLYSQLYHSFDPTMKLFSVVMLALLVGIGALCGGVIGILIPDISIGIELGVVFATLSIITLYTLTNVSAYLVFLVFSVFIGGGVYLTRKNQDVYANLRTCMVSGMVLAISVDCFLGYNLLVMIRDVLGGTTNTKEREGICISNCYIPFLLILWAGVGIVSFVRFVYVKGLLERWINSSSADMRPYQYDTLTMDASKTGKRESFREVKIEQQTFSYPDSLEYNYFDPDNLPEALKPYSDTVFPVVQSISKLYGFQVDSSRNQAEHLLMMLTNEMTAEDRKLNEPPLRLHKKMFSNYRKWCDRMGTPPIFCNPISGKRYVGYIEDMLVFLLIWGECANLRHLPECLCFLYHKLMSEYVDRTESSTSRNVYPGYFLDMVITPVYEVISKSMKKPGADHVEKKLYDDYNEFFWSPDCLRYRIFDDDDENDGLENGTGAKPMYISLESVTNPIASHHISRGLQDASKTYLEKRSWLHPLYAIHRVLEWHVISFTLLASLAFSYYLQWSYSFSYQVSSLVFWEISLMGIFWTCLEVWTLFPDTEMPGYSIFGYMLRIIAGFLVLAYQSVYFHWSFRPNGSPVLTGGNSVWASHVDSHGHLVSGVESGGNFWWWQYLWLSLIACSLYFLQSLMSLYPNMITSIMTWNNDYLQALLNICYPLSQQYTGKDLNVNSGDLVYYILYWLSLLSFKLVFGYYFIVQPVCVPTIELYDDYMNFQSLSFFKTCLLMFVYWFPHFLVYLIDLSIWYSVWSAGVGGYIALVERQGAVRDPTTFRNHFMRSPIAFCQKLMPQESYVAKGPLNKNLSTSSLTSLATIVVNGKDTRKQKEMEKDSSKERQKSDQQNTEGANTVDILGKMESGSKDDVKEGIKGFLDQRSMRWVVFARVWNEIILNLRRTDHLSNKERDIFLFSSFDWLLQHKPVYLPLYQTAGCVLHCIHNFKEASITFGSEIDPAKKIMILQQFKEGLDVTSCEALDEAFMLSTYLITELLGNTHRDDCTVAFETLYKWSTCDEIFLKINAGKVSNILKHLTNIITVLKSSMSKRKGSPVYSVKAVENLKHRQLQAQNNTKTSSANLSTTAGVTESEASDMHQQGLVAKGAGMMRRSVSTGFLAIVEENFDTNNKEGAAVKGASDDVDKSKSRFIKMQPFRKDIILVDNTRDKLRDEIRNLFNTIQGAIRIAEDDEIGQDMKEALVHVLSLEKGFLWDDLYASKRIDDFCADERIPEAVNKVHGLLSLRQGHVEPNSQEALRRMHFFINSLFMDMPATTTMRYCKEYTCMTPFYSEDVLLTKDDLMSKNSDGITTLLYLQTLYRQDWSNFVERRGIQAEDDQLIWTQQHLLQTRMWASYRAQTLFRTVEGMMYSEAAVRLMCELEQMTPQDTNTLAPLKFNYVVACQVYGAQRKNMDHKADDIEFLLARHPNLRVAYIDMVRVGRSEGSAFYSVLIKNDPNAPEVILSAVQIANAKKGGYVGMKLNAKEVYRVKLPGNAILGEGKPENQNHAIIFSRSRYIQAMDMNQDGYFEEALKMRNLLEEFNSGCTILGFREHIFTGSVSSVANYMALQELSFVTLGQRVLSNPLQIRQHYGHPDLFNKFFVMTEGGMSKASKGINLSEDVFAGFNATIRGHSVRFKEYAQVGKGRDVGLQQTYKFEAKLSQGNAEQSLSRDLSRICDRLDFFRLLSFYFGGIGHYVANTMVMFTLMVVVYIMLGLAIFGEEGVNGRKKDPEGFLQMVLAGMGVLQTSPLFITLSIEKGFLSACSQISYMFLSGGPLYFIFHIQTKAYYFSQTLLAGGAMYRPTGRGFVTRHSPFDENYRFFASSHLYTGFDLMMALILYGLYTTSTQYAGLTWSLWMTTAAFLFGPFWFNPITFEWGKIIEDYTIWINWMSEIGGSADQSWDIWWKEENGFYNKLNLSWKLLLVLQKSVMWGTVSIGLFGNAFFKDPMEQYKVVELLFLFCIYLFIKWMLNRMERTLNYAIRRVTFMIVDAALLVAIAYLLYTNMQYIRYIVALYYAAASVCFGCLLCGFSNVQYIYRLHDYLVGHTLFFFLAILSTIQLSYLQTWLLYHNALSAGVAIEDVLKYARRSKEMGRRSDSSDVVNELRAQLAEQERLLKTLMKTRNYGGGGGGDNGLEYGSINAASDPLESIQMTNNPLHVPESVVHPSNHKSSDYGNSADAKYDGSNDKQKKEKSITKKIKHTAPSADYNGKATTTTTSAANSDSHDQQASQSPPKDTVKDNRGEWTHNDDDRNINHGHIIFTNPPPPSFSLSFPVSLESNKASGKVDASHPSASSIDFTFSQPAKMPPRGGSGKG